MQGIHEELHSELDKFIKSLGFQDWNLIPLETPYSIDRYKDWLNQKYHGSMSYLETHLENKSNPKSLKPEVQSAFVFSHSYIPHPRPSEVYPSLNLAQYARGEDYHHWLKQKLDLVIEVLKKHFPSDQFYCFTDSGPVLERDLAARANLGWVGKNTCLINRKHGSFFFIAEIYSTLHVNTELAVPKDFCGNCNKCIEACPTQALEAPRLLNATKCISYLNIESREVPPVELRDKIQDWFFGCDICQNVCPWNQKTIRASFGTSNVIEKKIESQIISSHLIQTLKEVLESSGKRIEAKTTGTALRRAGSFGLKRNAIIVAANLKILEIIPSIEKLKDHPKLGGLAEWAIDKINQS